MRNMYTNLPEPYRFFTRLTWNGYRQGLRSTAFVASIAKEQFVFHAPTLQKLGYGWILDYP